MTQIDYSRCAIADPCQKRVFWATQVDACGEGEFCGVPCAAPGLRLIDVDECGADALECGDPCPATKKIAGRTIDTSNYVVGLAVNILMTDARKDETECGWLPGRLGGHWSEAFMGTRIGSRIRHFPTTGTVQEQTQLAETYARADLQKLVTYGVATRVDVSSKYLGRGVVAIEAVIYGPSGEAGRVGFKGARVANAWAWTT